MGNGTVRYTYAKLGSNTYTTKKPNKEGSYVVKATVAETDEYYGGVATCVFTISTNKQVPEISGIKSAYTKVLIPRLLVLEQKQMEMEKFNTNRLIKM